MNERRLARLAVTRECLMALLNGMADWCYVDLPGIKRFAPGTRVVNVHAEPNYYAGLVVTLEGPEFEEVPEGCILPLLNEPLTANHLVFRRLEETHECVGGEDVREPI